MPAFRIVYARGESESPQAITANFGDLDQALGVFAARGLRILYIAELGALGRVAERHAAERRPIGTLVEGARRAGPAMPARSSSFPLRRFSCRAEA